MERLRLNISLVEEMIEKGYISKKKHPRCDIYILDYCQSCTIDNMWNEATMMCRGLIVDRDYNILYKAYTKFFNEFEIHDKSLIPYGTPFKAYEKLDGSMGILYWIEDIPYMCTRGSFESDQAKHATNILHERYLDICSKLDRTKTYIFEIIYPSNHIVVNYGTLDDIILTGVIDTATGYDEDVDNYRNIGFRVAEQYDCDDFMKITEMYGGKNKEGFVIKFENGFRLKMKYDEYFRIHAAVSRATPKRAYELISQNLNGELGFVLINLDEENRNLFLKYIGDVYCEYAKVEMAATELYKEFETDKEAAEYFKQFKEYSGVLFQMRYKRPYDHIIWKKIKDKFKGGIERL